MSDDRAGAYASAELGSELRDEDPSGGARSYAGLVDDPDALRLLNYYDSLLDDPVEETNIGREIIANCSTQTLNDAVRHGNVSQMKAGTGLTNQEREGADLYGEAAELLSYEGTIGLMFGSPGSGKTATKVDVAKAWQIRTGGTLIGNFEWDGFEEVVHSDEEMFEAMAHIEGPVLCLLDEIAQELSGFGEGNKDAEAFSNSLLLVRKREEDHGPYPKKGSVLATAHTRTKTARAIRLITSFAIEKPSRENPGRARLLVSEADSDDWDEKAEFSGLTDTAETYDEYDASSFDVVAGTDDDGDDLDADDLRKDEHIKTAIKAVERGMGYGDIGKEDGDDEDFLVPYSREWVGTKYRQWRDKEMHRELVPRDD